MKKNGFIATSILYSFFLLFVSLFVATVSNYIHNQTLLHKINENAIDGVRRRSQLNLSFNFLPGDVFEFKANSEPTILTLNDGSTVNVNLNDNVKWILLSNDNTSNIVGRTLTFISDGNIFNEPMQLTKYVSIDPSTDLANMFSFYTNTLDEEGNHQIEASVSVVDDSVLTYMKSLYENDYEYLKMYDSDYYMEYTSKNGVVDEDTTTNARNLLLSNVLIQNGYNEYSSLNSIKNKIKEIFERDSDGFLVKTNVNSVNFYKKGANTSVSNCNTNDSYKYFDYGSTTFCLLNDNLAGTNFDGVTGVKTTSNSTDSTGIVGRMILTISIDYEYNSTMTNYPISYGNGDNNTPYVIE